MRIKLVSLIFLIVSVAVSAVILFPPKLLIAKSYCNQENMCKDSDCLQKLVDECNAQLERTKGTAATLATEIEYADNQINLSELNIQNTIQKLTEKEASIQKLTGSIADLIIRIDKMGKSVEFQETVLNERMRSRYKSIETSPIIILLGSDTLNKIVQKTEYLRIMELQDHKLITQMNDTKKAYGEQKILYEDTKAKEENLKQQIIVEKSNLESYQNDLQNQKDQKQKLLDDTQNDEARYQKLLNEAKTQLDSFTNFVSTAGGGVIESNGMGKGKEGWYYSQRDSRWANKAIGNSNYTIFDVGCLITSVAMIYNYYGNSVTPDKIASQDQRFFADTALMLSPWIGPSGKSYTPIYVSQIDDQLKSRPVIVGVHHGPYGTHFLVLSKKSGTDYIIYDPWYGPDLKFSDHYTVSSIFQAVVFK